MKLTLKRRKTPKIGIIGGVHIDIFADYDSVDKDKLDRIGELRYSIGGTGHNIAKILNNEGVASHFYSLLNKNSFSTAWIQKEFRTGCKLIKTNFEIVEDSDVENGFIALRENGELKTAVTSSFLDDYKPDIKRLRKTIRNKKVLVLDCNFSTGTLHTIFDNRAKKDGTITIIAATSDSKVNVIKDISLNYIIDYVTMNEKEAFVFFNKDPQTITCNEIPANIKNLVITVGKDGYLVFSNGSKTKYDAPNVSRIKSTSGAGDALTAAIVKTLLNASLKKQEFTWKQCVQYINSYVSDVLIAETVHIKPTRNKVSYRKLAFWIIAALTVFTVLIILLYLGLNDIALIITVISFILSIIQVVRSDFFKD